MKEEINITEDSYERIMKQSYMDYAMSVIVGRTFPDVRDGLKPVHRRILYSLSDLGIVPEKEHRKSARIVGEVLGKYHPHGDSSVYLAMTRMAQDFKMNEPLIDGQGNWGSVEGDSPASMRYTEAKLTPISMEMLKELNKEIVEFVDNFDGKEKEPTILPSILPNLFLNGTEGIAVGMRTEIPSHNLNELCNAIMAYIKKTDITTEELLNYLPGPDYCSGGIIVNKDEMLKLYSTGAGKVELRAKIDIEDAGYGKRNLIIKEVPYSQSGRTTGLIKSIIDLVKTKKLDEISDIRDESGYVEGEGQSLRIVLEVKKNVDIEKFLNKLYKKTKLQDTQSYSFLVIDKGEAKQITLIDYIKLYLEFQEEILTKKYNNLLKKSLNRKEVLDGLLEAINHIDLIIEILRGAKNQEAVKKCLMYGDTSDIDFKTKKSQTMASKFNFSEIQVNSILDMKLQRLISLEMSKLLEEQELIINNIAEYEGVLSDKKSLYKVIVSNLKYLQKKYGKERKTKLVNATIDKSAINVNIIEEDIQILIDRFGYIKTVDMLSVARSNEDTLKQFKYIFNTKNTDKLSIFTNKGNLYSIKLIDIPKGKIKDKGIPLDVLCPLEKDEEILLLSPFNNLYNNEILFIFNDGLIKKVNYSEFDTTRKKIVATKLYENELLKVRPITTEEKLVLKTNNGEHIIDLTECSSVSKGSKGQKTKLSLSETVIDIEIFEIIEKVVQDSFDI